MERKYIRYVAPLALATTFALSPMANATEIEFCGASIGVDDAVDARDCRNAINAAIAICSAPADGGNACASSVLVATLSCKTSAEAVYTIIKECNSVAKLERELKEVPGKVVKIVTEVPGKVVEVVEIVTEVPQIQVPQIPSISPPRIFGGGGGLF